MLGCSGWQEVHQWLAREPLHFADRHAAEYTSGADLLAALVRRAPIPQVCAGGTPRHPYAARFSLCPMSDLSCLRECGRAGPFCLPATSSGAVVA